MQKISKVMDVTYILRIVFISAKVVLIAYFSLKKFDPTYSIKLLYL